MSGETWSAPSQGGCEFFVSNEEVGPIKDGQMGMTLLHLISMAMVRNLKEKGSAPPQKRNLIQVLLYWEHYATLVICVF